MFHIQGHSKDFCYNMGYASKWLEMYFHLYTMGFNTFQQSWKIFMNLVCLSVRPSVHSLTLANVFQMCSTVFNFFQQSWKMFINLVWLSVCPSVSARSHCRKYSSNVFKFIHIIHIWYTIDNMKNYVWD